MLLKLIAIGIGGFIGSISRFGLVMISHHIYSKQLIPIGTLLVNIIGCFFIGFVYSWDVSSGLSERTKAFLITGILGGLTTFSAFGFETFLLMKMDKLPWAILNIGSQIVLGLAAVWLGALFYKFLF